MDITFLGTASAQPSPTRNHSSLALRIEGEVFLFDCGEATQHQLIKLNSDSSLVVQDPLDLTQVGSTPRLARINAIFLTHLHGDHCFGLPGLLCTAGSVVRLDAETVPNNPIHIYGPSGTKNYVRNALLHTMSRIGRGFVIHELLLPSDSPSTTAPHIDEQLGEDYQPETINDGVFWKIPSPSQSPSKLSTFSIKAAPIPHTVPTIGYLLAEPSLPGKLRADLITPHLLRNKEALNLKNPLSLLAKFKSSNEPIHLPDGTILHPSEYTDPPKRGRRVVILGDTSNALDSSFPTLIDTLDPPSIVDLVIHESTNACLKSDIESGLTPDQVLQTTQEHGHSTPDLAARFAKRVGARKLVLNHFSSRYKGDSSVESLGVMDEVRMLAVNEFGSENVVCARDFMQVRVVAE
ncbi:Metallo-hydrolase/oxidoreductase [Rhizoclosmatium globosum]|uniref:Metallo-hydrolase/oxidoreductase n=1 Tax=Rhizoclosmatium globosum TaxID=329046 RepID=A0A1Y2B0T1_9FUNG|nr:Metallo-hydrolase/oxidoreductase [Rhizoclosmatium globosum]|eukprot:ORY28422.1 Metallo-hydrolase/oxidoreductase [Rhizoclosmatium globosum]